MSLHYAGREMYRYDEHYGTVYKFSEDQQAYLAIGKVMDDETLSEAIHRIEEDEGEYDD